MIANKSKRNTRQTRHGTAPNIAVTSAGELSGKLIAV